MTKRTELEAMTVSELKTIIKENGIELTGAWKAKKEELIEAIIKENENEAIEMIEENFEQEMIEDAIYNAEVQELVGAEETEVVEEAEAEEIEEIQIVSHNNDIEEVKVGPEAHRARRNKKILHVVLEDNTIKDFESNKDFADFFNAKHETNFRSDIAWYLVRGRNKKAQKTFGIKTIEELDY